MGGANWGRGGSGALSGAASGATLGSVIPGLGTAIGGIGGGLLGGLSGLFGGGKGGGGDNTPASVARQNFGGGGGGGGKKGGPPKLPDLYGAAEAQGRSSQDAINAQTAANRPNISTPFANQQWQRGPDGQWNMSNSLAGGLGDASGAIQNQIARQAGTSIPTGEEGRRAASDAVYQQYQSRLDPQWNQREDALRSQLINQGLDPSSAASSRASGDFNRARNDAYGGAMRDAAVTGMGQQALNFQQDVQGRQLPFQQLQGLQGLTQMPGFNAAGAWQPTNYLGAGLGMGSLGAQQYQASQNKKGNTFGGLGQLGGAIATRGGKGGGGGGGAVDMTPVSV